MSFVVPPVSPCRQHTIMTDADLDRLTLKPFSSAHRSESSSTSSTSLSESTSSSSSGFSSSSERTPDYSVLEQLLQKIGSGIDQASIESISADMAFCNSVYRIQVSNETDSTTYYAKIFRPLALNRMTTALGTLDRLVAQQSLAPCPVAQTDNSILFTACQGRTLSEKDCHGSENCAVSRAVGRALGLLHSIPTPEALGTENILWKACSSMLDLCHADYTNQEWTLPKLVQLVSDERSKLESLRLPMVSCGHGDCKPCNIFVLDDGESMVETRFIDLELAGWHYRAFDLAKFFRTDNPTRYTRGNQHAFYESYLQHYRNHSAASSESIGAYTTTTVQDLQREVKFLLPMTWLEAAIFFVCMACQDEKQAERWNALAIQRLESYKISVLDRQDMI